VGTATFAILWPERDRMRPQPATIRVLIAAGPSAGQNRRRRLQRQLIPVDGGGDRSH
jgi:hypothetical protein